MGENGADIARLVDSQLTCGVERSQELLAVSTISSDQALLACGEPLSFLVDTSSELPAAVKGARFVRGEANP